MAAAVGVDHFRHAVPEHIRIRTRIVRHGLQDRAALHRVADLGVAAGEIRIRLIPPGADGDAVTRVLAVLVVLFIPGELRLLRAAEQFRIVRIKPVQHVRPVAPSPGGGSIKKTSRNLIVVIVVGVERHGNTDLLLIVDAGGIPPGGTGAPQRGHQHPRQNRDDRYRKMEKNSYLLHSYCLKQTSYEINKFCN